MLSILHLSWILEDEQIRKKNWGSDTIEQNNGIPRREDGIFKGKKKKKCGGLAVVQGISDQRIERHSQA